MAETKTTDRGSTGYTPYHNHTSVTTYDVQSNLRIRYGPGTGYGEPPYDKHMPGSWWTIAEDLWGWCREPNRDYWSSGDFMSPRYTTAPSPGQFRIDSIKITATRSEPSNKNLTVTYEFKCSNAAGTTETYYDWRVYCYGAKIGGGEVQCDIYNRSKSIGSNGSWSKSVSYTVEETSTNSSVTPGNYGVWYQGNGPFTGRDGGVGNSLTFDIPPYNPVTVPTCTAVNTSDRTETSIKLSGTFNANNGTIDKYRFKYKKDGDANWTESAETTSNSASFSSLTPNTKYWIGAKAHNEAGWGNYKEDVYFYTKPKANKPTASASEIKYNSFKITVTKNSTNYPDINYYGASYRKDGTTTWTNFSNQASNEFTASNLSPNTKYYIKGKARTKTGLDGTTAWSVDSDEVVVYTKPKAGTSTVACVRNNTTNSLNIKVTPVGNTNNASTSTYVPSANTYQVRYRKSGTATWIDSSTSTNQTITLSSLTANDSYEIQGRSRTAVGLDGTSTAWSNWSNSITVKVVRKATINTVEYNNINSSTTISLTVSYQNDYPSANRIYYAVVPQTVTTNPGRITNMYVATTGSPCTFNITKDYQGNALLPNTKYTVWIYVNQYKSNTDWYVEGLDLLSSVESLSFATQPDVGTLKDVKCIQNNTYNSLTFSAIKDGTWSKYIGWEYRYKKSSQLDSEYTSWSQNPDTNNKTISNLVEGETYDIQIRGSTGSVNDYSIYYSQVYKLTVRVVKKPKMSLQLIRLKENEIGIKGTITDKGYPEVTKLEWQYSSNSFITSTYVPGTWNVFKTINFGSTINTSQNCTYTNLYHYAMYNIRAKLTQYKTGAQWYTAGLNHSFDFDINNIELAMYNSRTSRLKGNNNGWKQVSNIKGWNGLAWEEAGTNLEPIATTDKKQIWGKLYWDDEQLGINNFYKSGQRDGNNQAVKDNFEVWIPGVDRLRWKGSTNSDNAYGGNLLDNKLEIDFSTIQKSDIDHNLPYLSLDTSKFDYKFNKNSISCKLKVDITEIKLFNIINLDSLSRVLPLKLIDVVYIELCTHVIPYGDDKAYTLIPHLKYTSKEDPSSQRGILYLKRKSENENYSKQLQIAPINLLENLGLGYTFDNIEFFNDHRASSLTTNSSIKIKNKGSIVNISNFNIYYTLM